MDNTNETTTVETPTPVAAAKPAKKAVKKAAVKKVVKKTVTAKGGKSTKTTVAKEPKERRIGKTHLACLRVLATSKTKVYPGVSLPGELKYATIAEEAGVAINNLTQVLAKSSTSGTEYPNSLQSKGFVDCRTYELPEGKQTSWLWSITKEGREFLKTVPKE